MLTLPKFPNPFNGAQSIPTPRPFNGRRGGGVYDQLDPSSSDFQLSTASQSILGESSAFIDNPTEGTIAKLEKRDQELGEQIALQRRAVALQLSIADKGQQMLDTEATFKNQLMAKKEEVLDKEREFAQNVQGYFNKKKAHVEYMNQTREILRRGLSG